MNADLAIKASIRANGVGNRDPVMGFTIKSLQLYCDYDAESYLDDSPTPQKILKEFQEKWKSEVHTAMLLPFDMDLVLGLEIRERTGLLLPKIVFEVPKLRIAFDPKQLSVLQTLLEDLAVADKRSKTLLRLRGIYGTRATSSPGLVSAVKRGTSSGIGRRPPMARDVGGMHFLPQLVIDNLRYPAEIGIPHNWAGQGLVAYLKSWGRGWTKRLWKHAISLVIEDQRKIKPLGRWLELIKLVVMRKEYAYMYSRFLRKSKASGNIIFYTGARVHPEIVERLFEYEMILPVSTVLAFRKCGMMVTIVELIRQRVKSQRKKGNNGPAERIAMSWHDILVMQSELIEAQSGNYSLFAKSH